MLSKTSFRPIAAGSLVFALGALTGCLSGPAFLKKGGGNLTSSGNASVAAVVQSDQNGVLSASLAPSSTLTQVVGASAESGVSGSQISFPPGSVAISTTVTVQQGAQLASSAFTTQLGLDPSVAVTSASRTVVFQSSTPTDAATPFTVAIQLGGSSLALDGSSNFAVLYNMYVAADGTYHQGLFPQSALTIVGNTVSFQVLHFGAFQVVTTSAPVTATSDIVTQVPIVTASQAAAAPFQLDNFAPLVVPGGGTVTLTGKNFRATMILALAGKPVNGLSVKSDSSASFVVPTTTTFGFNKLTVAQDGSEETHALFAMGDKSALPLITMDPSGVCSGVNYYDANGVQQTGTRACAAAAAATSAGDMQKAVYDKGNRGIVDKADVAVTAVTAGSANTANSAATAASATNAQSAAYSPGAQGADINAADPLVIPNNGTMFNVLTGAGTVLTVSHLTTMPPGTRITLSFPMTSGFGVTMLHSTGSGGLYLLRQAPTYYGPGDVVDFLSLSNGAWQQLSSAANHIDGVITSSNGTFTSPTPDSNVGTWTSGFVGSGANMTYNNSGYFDFLYAGQYQIFGTITVGGVPSMCPTLYLVAHGSSAVASYTAAGAAVSSVCTYVLPASNPPLTLSAGQYFFQASVGSTISTAVVPVSFRRIQ